MLKFIKYFLEKWVLFLNLLINLFTSITSYIKLQIHSLSLFIALKSWTESHQDITVRIDAVLNLDHPDKTKILKQTEHLQNPLMLALQNYSRKLTPVLINKIIDASLDPNNPHKNEILKQTDYLGWNPLILALENPSGTLISQHIDKIIDTVLAHPDKNNILKQTNNNGWSPLMLALRNPSGILTSQHIDKIIDTVLANPDKNNLKAIKANQQQWLESFDAGFTELLKKINH